MKITDTKLSKEELWPSTPAHCIRNRIKRTINFIDPVDIIGRIADCGENNPVKEGISKYFNINIISVDWDFNCPLKVTEKYNTILAFEVLEHTVNALTFMNSIRNLLSDNGCIYLSIPRVWPQWLRIDHHYHEIPTDRLIWLFNKAGFKVVKQTKISLRGDWYHYIFGLRPFLRGFWKTRIYKLKAI
jgi:hypothetical protein